MIGQPRAHLTHINTGRLLSTDGTLVEIHLPIDFETEWSGAVRHFPSTHSDVLSHCHRRAFVVVAHHVLDILNAERSFWFYVKWNDLTFRVTHRIRQIRTHVLGSPLVVIAPDASLAIAKCSKVCGSVGVGKREVGIFSIEVAFLSRKADDVLCIEAVLLVLEGELMNAALIGVAANAIVRDAHSNPHSSLASRAFAYHLKNPRFVWVGHGEAFSFALKTICIDQTCHHFDSFAGSLGALKAKDHERTIIDESAYSICQLSPAAVGRLVNRHLKLVHEAYNAVSMSDFRNLAQVVVALVVIQRMHRSGRMIGCRNHTKRLEGSIVILAVGDNHAAILRGLLADNQVRARMQGQGARGKGQEKTCQ